MAEEPVTNNELEETEEEVVKAPKENDAPQGDKPAVGQREERPRERRDQRRSRYRGRQEQGRSTGGYRRPGRFYPRRKVCMFCADKVKVIDWKNVDNFRRLMNNNGSIRARRKTGTCAKHQRQLAVAIKRARHLALTPYTDDHVRLYGRR